MFALKGCQEKQCCGGERSQTQARLQRQVGDEINNFYLSMTKISLRREVSQRKIKMKSKTQIWQVSNNKPEPAEAGRKKKRYGSDQEKLKALNYLYWERE